MVLICRNIRSPSGLFKLLSIFEAKVSQVEQGKIEGTDTYSCTADAIVTVIIITSR